LVASRLADDPCLWATAHAATEIPQKRQRKSDCKSRCGLDDVSYRYDPQQAAAAHDLCSLPQFDFKRAPRSRRSAQWQPGASTNPQYRGQGAFPPRLYLDRKTCALAVSGFATVAEALRATSIGSVRSHEFTSQPYGLWLRSTVSNRRCRRTSRSEPDHESRVLKVGE